MGACNLRNDNSDPSLSINRHNFQFHYAIGKGGFGKVWKVTQRKTKKHYAMKLMLKTRVVSKRSVNSVMNQRKLLSYIQHPFIVNMNFAFQDRQNLYLVLDIMPGGDLRYHLGRQKRFSQQQTKFFAACLVLALQYIHLQGIIHRDIKPQNLVLDQFGYLKLTDFGIARMFQPQNGHQTSGTPGYMSPEVLCRMNHSCAADYFALGIIVYEFMMGRRPYIGRNRKEIRDAVLAKQVQLTKHEIPPGWSVDAVDFTNKLIQRKPGNRLGVNGPNQVKGHAWFRGFSWDLLMERKMESPYVPEKVDNFDQRQVLNEWKDQAQLAQIRERQTKGLFGGYFYDASRQQIQQMGLSKTCFIETSKIVK